MIMITEAVCPRFYSFSVVLLLWFHWLPAPELRLMCPEVGALGFEDLTRSEARTLDLV